jgi:hypothetical protein
VNCAIQLNTLKRYGKTQRWLKVFTPFPATVQIAVAPLDGNGTKRRDRQEESTAQNTTTKTPEDPE